MASSIVASLACAQCRGRDLDTTSGAPAKPPASAASAMPPLPSSSASVSASVPTTWNVRREALLVGPDIGAGFGDAVALGDDVLVIGAPADTIARAGAAYVYVRRDGAWGMEQKLTAKDGFAGNAFGTAVALLGETLLVGAPRDRAEGAVYVYVRRDGRWHLAQKLVGDDNPSGDFFGSAIALGRRWMMVGANGGYRSAGAAYLFERAGETWKLAQKLAPPDDNGAEVESINFGFAVAVGEELAAATSLYTEDYDSPGAVYAFALGPDGFRFTQKLLPEKRARDDAFGAALALEGDTLLVGARYRTHRFMHREGRWAESEALATALVPVVGVAQDALTRPVAVALHGDRALAGAGTFFARDAGTFAEVKVLAEPPKAPHSRVPSLAIHDNLAAIGVPREGGRGAVQVWTLR
ncbi:Glycoprotein gp2 [Minicystis rosea]|nr:Glycoprotein gp2 [Minicystis rosea]